MITKWPTKSHPCKIWLHNFPKCGIFLDMREKIPQTTDALEQMVADSFQEDSMRPINIGTLNMDNRHSMLAKDGAKNVKHSHPIWMLGAFFIFMVAGYLFSPVNMAQAETFAAEVKMVALCEGVKVNSVHNQMKKLYDYNEYTKMNKLDYFLGRWTLGKRKCDTVPVV